MSPLASMRQVGLLRLQQAASKYANLLENITSMLAEMSLLMPQLASYTTLFPGHKALDMCIDALIDDYVGFCIEAILFFHRSPICNTHTSR